MFNKEGNSNKFQMKAWTGEKGASKSLRKIDEPSKVPKKDRNKAVQIEAALRKCNPDILDRINRGNSALENEKQMDNPFDTNRDKPNADDVTENMEDSESSLSSRMASSSPEQYSSRLLGKKPMLIEANQKEKWRTVIHETKKYVLFVQALDIPKKIMRKKMGWIYDLLGDVRYLLEAVIARNQEIRMDFFQVAGKDQARKILANNKIESFLMTTDGVNIQMAGQKKVLVRDIPLGISDKEVGAAMKKFGEVKKIQIRVASKWQSTVVEYNNQKEATKAVDQWSTMVRKDAVRIYPIIRTQKIIEQKKTWEAKLVDLPQNYTAYYLSTTLDQIRA
ncbi:hypothetical protein G9A89_009484 [Geosiphon pyriformis]|nr:hypothetical protein G9A89_009484 [Geosiphon pyriformis]